MRQQLMKKTVIYSVIFAVAAMAFIVYTASHKVIMIADVAQDEVQVKAGGGGTASEEKGILTFGANAENADYLCIPFQEGIKAETVKIENRYMDHELWISFENDCSDFYKNNQITGNKDNISKGYYEQEEKKTILKFSLTGVFEYRSILEENNLYIEFLPPKEMYEKIVVIDPAGGGEEYGARKGLISEKEVTLEIAKKLKEKLDATDIKVYYTRMEDVYPDEASRAAIANDTQADMLIRIQVGANADSSLFGTRAIYNESYFIPGFGSIELADLLEREVVTSIRGKAIGLVAANESEYVLQEAMVPAAGISVGYITNEKEEALLKSETYLEKIADGLYNAILKAYE